MVQSKRPRRTFTRGFKHQLIQLYKNGKRKCDNTKEYDVGYSTLDKWIKQEENSGSFKEKNNLTPEQLELIKLRKQNQQLLMENDIYKASSADLRTKVKVIKNNLHKYSVPAMCRVLKTSRSTYYYEAKQKADESELVALIKNIFKESRNNYGIRKIKKELAKKDLQTSRRRIGRIMKQEGLVSSYTVAQFKVHKSNVMNQKQQILQNVCLINKSI